MTAVMSPCTGVCCLDASGRCEGCFRTPTEIGSWLSMSDDERRHLMDVELPQRASTEEPEHDR